MDVDLSADGLRYVVQIWLVPTGHDDVRETSTVGCKQLLLDASDGEDLALRRHLASHTQSASDWPTGEQTGERSHHGDTRRRAVLRHRARRYVHMEMLILEGGRVDAKLSSVRTDVGQRDPYRFLHDIAELAGECQAFIAIHMCSFDEQHVTTNARDCQPGGNAGRIGSLGNF